MVDQKTYFNPFPGLRSFEENEEYLFFGREKQIDDLLDKLEQTHFLAVIGTSGSGKSSLVKSGLLPSLHSGFIRGVGKGWRIGVFRPGGNPIGNLASCLCSGEFVVEENEEESFNLQPIVESVLRRSDQGILNVVDQFLNRLPENILLVADQFEELFRFSKCERTSSKGTRDAVLFINLLLAAIEDKKRRIYVVFTMRSDFIGNCTEFRGLPEAMSTGQYLIPRMSRNEIQLAITGPIAVAGAEISPQLVSMLLNEVGDNPDQLPILQHALMRTYDYWSEHTNREAPIAIEHYHSIGKMELALSYHADEAYYELTEEQKIICAALFKSLTETGTVAGGVRRPTKLLELCELLAVDKNTLIPIINVFRKHGRSFLMPSLDIELHDESVIDISHESLMRVWIRLIDWFKEEMNSAEIYLKLCKDAASYEEGKGFLLINPELAITLKWREKQRPTEAWGARYNSSFVSAINFLEDSKAKFDQSVEIKNLEQAKRIKRNKTFTYFVAIASVILLFLATYLWRTKQKAQTELTESKQGIELYNVIQKALAASRDEMIARLRGEKAESEVAVAELQARFGQELSDRFAAEYLLIQKVDEQQRKLLEFARELADKNLDNASELYFEAYELFKEGKILEVIKLLDEEKLQTSREQTKQVAAAIKKQQIQQLIATFSLKADALALEFRYMEVVTKYREIIDIHVENELPSTDFVGWYDELGGVLLDNNKYPPALEAYKTALAIREEVLEAPHPDLARSFDNIGWTYERMGSYEQALEYQQKALAIREEVLEVTDLDLATSYNNIGGTYQSMGNYIQALEYYQKALAIYKETPDATHHLLTNSYSNIGGAYESMGNYDQALEYHQKALVIWEELLDATHPYLAVYYNVIGGKYKSIGRYEQALEYHQKALVIYKETLDATDPYLAISYSNTAIALIGLQQYKTAQDYLHKAIAIFTENKHPSIIRVYGHMGLLQLKLGTTSKAQEYFSLYNELAKDKDKALGAYYQALYHTVIGDLQKALDFLEEAVARGYTNRVHITQEELLASLYKEARYQALVEKLQKKNPY